jgi:aminoglycoside 6'-N-acetyltransferase I
MRFAPPLNLADPAWLSMRCSLWPETPAAEHLCDMADTLARGHRVLLAQDEAGTAVGFVEASIRNDYVNGTETSPVAFIEGLYVEPGQRRRGVARALIAEIAAWGRAQGCSELASDSPIGNVEAHAFHRALGFAEAERVVCFCKPLNDDQGA